MKTTESCPPIWVAVGMVFVTPVAAAAFVFFGVIILIAWPIMPFYAYRRQSRKLKPDKP